MVINHLFNGFEDSRIRGFKSSEAPRTSARGIFTASAKPAEAHPPSLTYSPNLPSPKRLGHAEKVSDRQQLRRIPFSHSSPSFRIGHSAKAGKRDLRRSVEFFSYNRNTDILSITKND